jgi:hypothetical protein
MTISAMLWIAQSQFVVLHARQLQALIRSDMAHVTGDF